MINKEICHAWIDDPTSVQYLGGSGKWFAGDANTSPLAQPEEEWRIRPATITINGTELPKPVDGVSNYEVFIRSGDYPGCTEMMYCFNTREDRDAVYSKLVEVLGS